MNKNRGDVMMKELMAFITAAVVIEGLVSYAKMIVVQKKIQWQVITAIAIGLLLAFNLHLDIFALLEIEESCTLVGTALTGILISRGSNYVYDLYDRLVNWKREGDHHDSE